MPIEDPAAFVRTVETERDIRDLACHSRGQVVSDASRPSMRSYAAIRLYCLSSINSPSRRSRRLHKPMHDHRYHLMELDRDGEAMVFNDVFAGTRIEKTAKS